MKYLPFIENASNEILSIYHYHVKTLFPHLIIKFLFPLMYHVTFNA